MDLCVWEAQGETCGIMHGTGGSPWRIPCSSSSSGVRSRCSDEVKQVRKGTGPRRSAAPSLRARKNNTSPRRAANVAGEKNGRALRENKDNQGFLSFFLPSFSFREQLWLARRTASKTWQGRAHVRFYRWQSRLVDNWKGSLGLWAIGQEGGYFCAFLCNWHLNLLDRTPLQTPSSPVHTYWHTHTHLPSCLQFLLPSNCLRFLFLTRA